jgi:hypothetical protein
VPLFTLLCRRQEELHVFAYPGVNGLGETSSLVVLVIRNTVAALCWWVKTLRCKAFWCSLAAQCTTLPEVLTMRWNTALAS